MLGNGNLNLKKHAKVCFNVKPTDVFVVKRIGHNMYPLHDA